MNAKTNSPISPKYTIKTKTQIEKNKNRVILGKKSGSEVEK